MKNIDLILEYVGLDLKKIPKSLESKEPIDIKSSEIKSEKDYKIYKYIPIKDVNILITNSLRLDEPAKKIESVNVLSYYLNKKNTDEYISFMKAIQTTSVEDIQDIENIQQKFSKDIPSKIKYEKDYLWQIYYIKRTQKYYMIVPLQETKQQAFLYVLKKKLEKSKEKIYVPICNLDYGNSLIENNKIGKLENYLYYFTNNWPGIYEVQNNKKQSVDIVGQLEIYEGVTSDYKIHFDNKENIDTFYELVKVLFEIQTELSSYFKFEIILDENGGIHFYYNEIEITYSSLKQFYKDEIKNGLDNIEQIDKLQEDLNTELNNLKIEERKLNADLLNKQKQISTFLECKKTFFGRVKYFFKYGKKKKDVVEENSLDEVPKTQEIKKENHVYYDEIEDLIHVYKELKAKTILDATTKIEIQNINIKIEILKTKIENAALYIKEIESHKKSIFEFWKFTNKDEKNQLTEGIIKVGSTTKIEKAFILKEDLEDYGKQMDLIQRKLLKDDECESILVTGTIILKDINLILKGKSASLKEIPQKLVQINEKLLPHRECARKPEKYLKLTEKMTNEEYFNKLTDIIFKIENALKKNVTNVSIPVYCLTNPKKELSIFDINPKNIIKEGKELNLYKLNVKQGSNLIAFTNIIFFNNRNQTLPVGMNYSNKVLIDLSDAVIKKQTPKSNYIITLKENSQEKQVTKINLINIEIKK